MPHKTEVVAAVDRLTPTAARLGAVNTIIFGDEVVGDSTDGAGFLAGLPAGLELQGARAVVVGAGGAARAIVLALVEAGVADLAVLNRNADRGAEAAELAGKAGRLAEVADIAAADLVVNATPVGMAGAGSEGRMPFEPQHLRARQVFVDLVYNPRRTPLMQAASEQGVLVIGGIPMLVNQAAAQFSAWTGLAAPLDAMEQAIADP